MFHMTSIFGIYTSLVENYNRDRRAFFFWCKCKFLIPFFIDWDSLHASLNSHNEAWSYKKKKHKKITAYRKSVQKEPTVKICLLILDLKPLR